MPEMRTHSPKMRKIIFFSIVVGVPLMCFLLIAHPNCFH